VGCRYKNGYGCIVAAGRQTLAHRFSWVLHNGPIPDDLCVLHRCDVPRCIRPDHLFLGTRRENVHDMSAKGRQARGERNRHAKLTEVQVMEIRARYEPRSRTNGAVALGCEFSVHYKTIRGIVAGRKWKHLLPVPAAAPVAPHEPPYA
jgi:hypothetical protein